MADDEVAAVLAVAGGVAAVAVAAWRRRVRSAMTPDELMAELREQRAAACDDVARLQAEIALIDAMIRDLAVENDNVS